MNYKITAKFPLKNTLEVLNLDNGKIYYVKLWDAISKLDALQINNQIRSQIFGELIGE